MDAEFCEIMSANSRDVCRIRATKAVVEKVDGTMSCFPQNVIVLGGYSFITSGDTFTSVCCYWLYRLSIGRRRTRFL